MIEYYYKSNSDEAFRKLSNEYEVNNIQANKTLSIEKPNGNGDVIKKVDHKTSAIFYCSSNITSK